MFWEVFFMLVVLKIPIAYLVAVVVWAIRAEPRPLEGAPRLVAPTVPLVPSPAEPTPPRPRRPRTPRLGPQRRSPRTPPHRRPAYARAR